MPLLLELKWTEKEQTKYKCTSNLVAFRNRSCDTPSHTKIQKSVPDCGSQPHHHIPKGLFQLIYSTSHL